MPNIIPPIVSSSPPPLDPVEDDNEDDDDNNDGDDFGDFNTADFGPHIDSIAPKITTDTWTQPKQLVTVSKVVENGCFVPELPSVENISKPLAEGLDDEDLSQNADTSHDSLVSAVLTDSGNCSASQNSNGTSPMPNLEVEDESNDKSGCLSYPNDSDGNDGQVQNDILLRDSEVPNCVVPDTYQISNNLDSVKDCVRTLQSISSEIHPCSSNSSTVMKSSETLLDVTGSLADMVISGDDNTNQTNATSLDLEGQFSGCKEQESMETNADTPTDSEKNDIPSLNMGNSSVILLTNNPRNSSDKVNVESEGELSTGCHNSNTEESDCEAERTTNLDRKEENFENECLRAMIIPDVLGLDEDDEFGDFNGASSVSGVEYTEEQRNEPQFDSPSRRPTLVLYDESKESGDVIKALSYLEDAANTPSESFKERGDDENNCTPRNEDSAPNLVLAASDNSHILNPPYVDNFQDDGFADFTQAQAASEAPLSAEWAQAAQVPHTSAQLPFGESSDFDDFDDFESAEFQSANTAPSIDSTHKSLFDLETLKSNLDQVLNENFPISQENCLVDDSDNVGGSGLSGTILDVEESLVWQGLRDLEATPSLSFQWPGSHSNRGLLGALNIDSRNILFGPKWNTVVPRFAANLGFSPLEPVRAVPNQPPSEPSPKSEIIQPETMESSKTLPDRTFQEVVPAAQFDWSDSGLVNPLDSSTHSSSLLDLDLLASFDNLASCSSQVISTPHAAMVCRRLSTNGANCGPLATTAASGTPVLSSTPLQVEQLLANSKRSTPVSSLEKKRRDPSLSPDAVRVLDTLPELAFLSARMLMFPVQSDRNENKL